MIIAISGKIGSGKDTVGNIIQMLTSPNNKNEYFYKIGIDNNRLSEYDFSDSKWKIKKFAGKIKHIVSILTGIPVEDLEKQDVKMSKLPESWDYYTIEYYDDSKTIELDTRFASYELANEYINSELKMYSWQNIIHNQMTVRQLLQEVGTDAMRDVIHPNVWINALFADYFLKESEYAGVYTGLTSKKYPNWIITDLRFPNELEAVEKRNGITIRVNRKNINTVSPIGTPVEVDRAISSLPSTHPSETALDNSSFDYVINNNGTIKELVEKVKDILIKEKLI